MYLAVLNAAMDELDRKIVDLLAADAKRSLADMGGVVGLSVSAVNERVKRLTETGVIRRMTVDADPAALGVPVLAFIFVVLSDEANEIKFADFAAVHREIVECHHVSGQWSYLIKVQVADLGAIEAFLSRLKRAGFLGRSETLITLSSPVAGPFVPK